MKCASNLKRLLSFIMVFAMVLSLLPAAAFAADTTMLYLKPNGNWTQASARFAAYFFGNGEKWVSMTDSNGDGVYEVEAPAGYPKVIFCRMNPSTTDNNWNNKWNQTGDLTIPTDGKNLFTIPNGSGDGATTGWSVYTYVAPLYTIAGTISPAGWSPENGEKLTDEDADGIFTYTYTDVAAGSYEFKVTNGTWDAAWPSDNYKLTVEDEGSSVTVIFDAVKKTVSTEVVKEYSVTFVGANVTSDGAGVAVKGSEYTATLTAAEGYDLPETVTVTMGGAAADHSWDAATGLLTIAAVTGDVVITAEGVEQAKYLYLKPNSNWTQANARFAAYFFGNGELWVSMTDADFDGVYEVVMPEGYPNVIFCRMNPATTANNFLYRGRFRRPVRHRLGCGQYGQRYGQEGRRHLRKGLHQCLRRYLHVQGGYEPRLGQGLARQRLQPDRGWGWQDCHHYLRPRQPDRGCHRVRGPDPRSRPR